MKKEILTGIVMLIPEDIIEKAYSVELIQDKRLQLHYSHELIKKYYNEFISLQIKASGYVECVIVFGDYNFTLVLT